VTPDMNLKPKILLLYAIVSLCVLAATGILLSAALKRDKLRSIYFSLQAQLSHIDFALTGFFAQFEEDLAALASDPAVRTRQDGDFTRFTEADESTFQYRYGEREKAVIDLFRRYADTHGAISSVYMGRENGSFVRARERERPTRYDPRTRPWYRLARDNPGRVMRTDPYRSITSPDINIGIVTALTDEAGQVFGVVGMDVTLATLKAYIEGISFGHDGYLLLMVADGTILATRDTRLLNQPISALCPEDLSLLFGDDSGVIPITRDRAPHYLIFRASPALGWRMVCVVPAAETDAVVWTLVSRALKILTGALALLSLLTLAGVAAFVIKPLRRLNEVTRHIARTGDLDTAIRIESRDEIGDLARSFNQMTQDLKTYIRELMETTAARERDAKELKIAHDIQMGILPGEFPPAGGDQGFEIHAALRPAKQVGGDLYDFFLLDDGRLCFCVGDVSGKGVPAALFMSAAKTLIKALARVYPHPETILAHANRELESGNDYGTFVTVFLGILDIRTGRIDYVNAGHNPPLLLRADGDFGWLSGTKNLPLGIEDAAEFHCDHLVLAPAEAVFLYTDGVTEALDARNELFSEERLIETVAGCWKTPAKGVVEAVMDAVRSFAGSTPQSDDITVMMIRYRP